MKFIELTPNFSNLYCNKIGEGVYQVHILAGPMGNFYGGVAEGFVKATTLLHLDPMIDIRRSTAVRFVLNQDVMYNDHNDVTDYLIDIIFPRVMLGGMGNTNNSMSSYNDLRSVVSTMFGTINNWLILNPMNSDIAIGTTTINGETAIAPIYKIDNHYYAQDLDECKAFLIGPYAQLHSVPVVEGEESPVIVNRGNITVLDNDIELFTQPNKIEVNNPIADLVAVESYTTIKLLNDLFSIPATAKKRWSETTGVIEGLYNLQLTKGRTNDKRFVDPDVINSYICFNNAKLVNYEYPVRTRNFSIDGDQILFEESKEALKVSEFAIICIPAICVADVDRNYHVHTGVVIGNKVLVKIKSLTGPTNGYYLSDHDVLTILQNIAEQDLTLHNWLLFNN